LFRTLCDLVPCDRDYPERVHRLDVFRRILDGTIYDLLPYEFHQERTDGGEYIPLRKRRPSVRYALPRIVVEDSVALLFSEGHFPVVESADRTVRTALASLMRCMNINSVMVEAGLRGSVGSVAILLRVLRSRPFLTVIETLYLTPSWAPDAPDTLCSVVERYKVPGRALLARGYDIADPEALYWFMRRWDPLWETWFQPWLVGRPGNPVVDDSRSVRHGLGFVPIAWIRNLPGGDEIDGACTFRSAIETSIEIDYQLSQAGRGLKYSSDPTLLIREPAGLDGDMVHGAANALVVSEKGDAKLLEIGGTASQAVIDYVRVLRELALESLHGNRVDASRLTAPASGRALELMNQGLLWLADNLRVSYGEAGLLRIARMLLGAASIYPLTIEGTRLPRLDAEAPLALRWPNWYPDDALEKQRVAETVSALVAAKQLSRETAMRVLAPTYGIDDAEAELAHINSEAFG
jgi:hypothetical protein